MWRKRGVPCLRGVREPGGVSRCGVKTWRHLPTWRQGAGWRLQMNVVKTRRHLLTWREGARWRRWSCSRVHAIGLTWRQAWRQSWRQNVASLAHLLTWCQRATWRRRTWRQNVPSSAIDLRGVAGRGVNTWRQEPGTCLQNVFQSFCDMFILTGDPPEHTVNRCVCICIHMSECMDIYIIYKCNHIVVSRGFLKYITCIQQPRSQTVLDDRGCSTSMFSSHMSFG